MRAPCKPIRSYRATATRFTWVSPARMPGYHRHGAGKARRAIVPLPDRLLIKDDFLPRRFGSELGLFGALFGRPTRVQLPRVGRRWCTGCRLGRLPWWVRSGRCRRRIAAPVRQLAARRRGHSGIRLRAPPMVLFIGGRRRFPFRLLFAELQMVCVAAILFLPDPKRSVMPIRTLAAPAVRVDSSAATLAGP